MNNSDPSNRSRRPHETHHTGALALALLAIAAFCGWYLAERDWDDDAGPLPVVQKPIMPPTTTDTSSDLPGHTHYMIFESKDPTNAPKQP